jgi:hypothetical protein
MYVVGWKLNGPALFSASTSPAPLIVLAALWGNVALAGVNIGVARCDAESLGLRVAYCLEGNVADMGDKALTSWPSCPAASSPSSPSPRGRGASLGGGVGVRGGTGSGMCEAMCG